MKSSIMNDLVFILDSIRKDRYFLNKHFQNSISNYFLEDYAGSFLKEHLNMYRAKEISTYIANKTQGQVGTKYMKIMHGYFEELKQSNTFKQFQNLLIQNIFNEHTYNQKKGSKEWQSIVWKRGFSLFVYHASLDENKELKGIFEIWNSLFPNSQINRKRQENVSHRQEAGKSVKIENITKDEESELSHNQEQFSQIDSQQVEMSMNDNQDSMLVIPSQSYIQDEYMYHSYEQQNDYSNTVFNIDCNTQANQFQQYSDQFDLVALIREANEGHISPQQDGLCMNNDYWAQSNSMFDF